MKNAIARFADEVQRKELPKTYTLFPRAPNSPDPDPLYAALGWDRPLQNVDTEGIDREGVGIVLSYVNQALDQLRNEGHTVNKITDALMKHKEQIKLSVYANGKIVEVEASPDTRIALVHPTATRIEIAEYSRTRNATYPLGLPTITGIAAQHWWHGFDYPYTVGMMEDARTRGQSLHYVWGYPESVVDSIVRTDKEKGAGTFERTHGFGLHNYRDMPHERLLDIARTPASKSAGVKPLDWKLFEVSPDGHQEEVHEVTRVPFEGNGVDGVIIHVQPDVSLVVGGRGGSSKFGTQVLEGNETMLGGVKGYEGFRRELEQLIDSRPSNTGAIEIAAITQLNAGIVNRVFDVIGCWYYKESKIPEINPRWLSPRASAR